MDRWVKSIPEQRVYVSVLTLGEIRRGIEVLPLGRRKAMLAEWQEEVVLTLEDRILPITKGIADRWAILAGEAHRVGRPLATVDGLIAATAVEHGLVLATRNVKDFVNLPISILDPWKG